MKHVFQRIATTADVVTSYTLDSADSVSGEVKKTIETHVSPLRHSFVRRYPVLFSILGIFGVATTYYGFEKILSQYEMLQSHPWLILVVGLAVLTFTGHLYKKLN